MPPRPGATRLFPTLTCQEITDVVHRLSTAEVLLRNVLAMAALTRHCEETPVHDLDCIVADPDHPTAAVVAERLARARDMLRAPREE